MNFNHKLITQTILSFFIIFSSNFIFAANITDVFAANITDIFATDGRAYIGGSLGASRAKIQNGNPTIVYFNGQLKDEYPLSDQYATRAVGSLNGGYEFSCLGRYLPAIAIGLGLYSTMTDYSFNGQVIETAIGDAPSTLYNYNYDISSIRLMLETLFTWQIGHFVAFVDAGIGPAWNRTNGYEETPVDRTGYVAVPPFQSNNDTKFAYQLGLGVGYSFNFYSCPETDCERISLGYRYVNLGNTTFGTRGAVYPHQLNTGRLTSNEIYLAFTHLI